MLRKPTGEEQAADKAKIVRLWRLYKAIWTIPGCIVLIIAFTVTGYLKGYLDGYLGRPHAFQKEQTK